MRNVNKAITIPKVMCNLLEEENTLLNNIRDCTIQRGSECCTQLYCVLLCFTDVAVFAN